MPDADAEHRPAGGDALADRVVEPPARAARGALDVTDARDDRERRLAHDPGSLETTARARAASADRRCAGCRRRSRRHDPHAAPFVERMPAAAGCDTPRAAPGRAP